MADTGGTGSANGATVHAKDSVGELEARLTIAREQAKSAFYVDQVAKIEAHVAKVREGLAGAEASLEDAKRQLADEQARAAAVTTEEKPN